MMNHLVNHLCHFPMGIGASRLSSSVSEFHDIIETNLDDLKSDIFTAPNVQVRPPSVNYLLHSWFNDIMSAFNDFKIISKCLSTYFFFFKKLKVLLPLLIKVTQSLEIKLTLKLLKTAFTDNKVISFA